MTSHDPRTDSSPSSFGGAPPSRPIVLGAGTWGVALADVLARNGLRPRLWDHAPERLEDSLRGDRVHYKLDGYVYHAGIESAGELTADTVPGDAWIVCAVPSFATREAMERLRAAGVGGRGERFVLTAKGLELSTRMTMAEVAADVFGAGVADRLAVLSGPSHAEETVHRQPTTVVAASRDAETARAAQALFMNETFRVYAQSDVRGVELGGAFKNVYAIAAGTIVGLGFGDNTLAAMMTRGLAEMSRLGVAMGAEPATFAGLAGLGDLIVTCCSRHSRNRRFGELRAKGRTTEEAQTEIGQAIEGLRTARAMRECSAERGVETPIAEAVYDMIHQGKNPLVALRELMTREPKDEDALAG